MHIPMLIWCIINVIRTYNIAFLCEDIAHLLIIKVISCSNISACIFLKIFFIFEYKCMHLFSKTKCIFKYKCIFVYARGYGSCRILPLHKKGQACCNCRKNTIMPCI